MTVTHPVGVLTVISPFVDVLVISVISLTPNSRHVILYVARLGSSIVLLLSVYTGAVICVYSPTVIGGSIIS